jgi:hypothetical protein
MSLYKALIDFRDNDNDPMWIKQEDTDDIVRVRSINKTKRGKSLLYLDFDNETYIKMFTDADGRENNNSFLINVALGRGYYGDSVFIDTYYFGDEEMKEGAIFRYFSNENMHLLKKILRIAAPSLLTKMENKYDEIGRWLLSNFERNASEIASVFGYEYDSALVQGLRQYINKKFCNVFTPYGIVEKTCASEYYTTVDNLIKFWDNSGADKELSITEMFKSFILEKGLELDEDLFDDYYHYYEEANFDQMNFDRTVDRELESILEKLEEQQEEGTLALNLEIYEFLSKQQYQFDVWYPQKSEKTFGKVEKNIGKINYFKFDELSDGEVIVLFQTPSGVKKSSMDLERLKLFLYHPELF